MRSIFVIVIASLMFLMNCKGKAQENVSEVSPERPFVWEGANLYFLLTDRFNNGDASNDVNFNRTKETGILRGFEGGDLKGITQKIKEGYFTDLGINAIWMTPVVEQIHDGTDEGTGFSYGFHGYWTSDWTNIDPNFGTKEDLKELVATAHENGIRILLDAVINHTGPVTEIDTVWPEEWVRTSPKCEFQNYETTVTCTLVANLPDIRTESNDAVDLPPQLVKKWKDEGRFDQEVAELDEFFERTGHPRAPRFYIMKWLSDYISEYGIDGYRVDTVKHTEEYVWQEFKKECDYQFAQWKANNPEKVLDDNEFYLVGEVYNYGISNGQMFDIGDRKVNYFEDSFHSLINFELKYDANNGYEEVFTKYSDLLQNEMKNHGTLNYLSSHDDGNPFDPSREKPFETANRLLLTPGTSQVYYGDEVARPLLIEGTQGDATLRSTMNWTDIESNEQTKAILEHWQKLGRFRAKHPAVGAGLHKRMSKAPYVFSRSYSSNDFEDVVVIGIDLPKGNKSIDVSGVFLDGDIVHDAYSSQDVEVIDGKLNFSSEYEISLFGKN